MDAHRQAHGWRLATALSAVVLAVSAARADLDTNAVLTRIAFGSCANQGFAQDFWDPILATRPQLFIFAGDNIYSDTYDLAKMRAKYAQLAAEPGFQRLRAACPILATWDDHDYGLNDSGAEFKEREGSRAVFLDFFDVPASSPRRQHGGIYDAVVIGPPGRRVQVILLDTRYFRGPLVKLPERAPDGGRYTPSADPKVTLLGDEQWAWLETQLRQPAELRLLVSSIQVASIEHHWEHWGNFPRERARLLRLIRKTRAKGVIILSGDRHQAELSLIPEGAGYPLYDLTSSGMNNARGHVVDDPNSRRLAGPFFYNNVGAVRVNWRGADSEVTLEVRDLQSRPVIQQRVPLSALQLTLKPSTP
ncbi:MAG: alkaline phosphatase family protein [Lentisphaerae bacterium]|nr:alkaline phosphatase family protein [Lentisphaerota bacterium]